VDQISGDLGKMMMLVLFYPTVAYYAFSCFILADQMKKPLTPKSLIVFQGFTTPSFDDKIIEVVAIFSCSQMVS
jgi:hypothetical protein